MGKGNIPRRVTGAGPNLHRELEKQGIDVTVFQKEMKRRGVRGSAYSTIWGYLKGRVEPAREFLQEASDYLGVREEYLLTGEGPRTENEERLAKFEDRGPGSPFVDVPLEQLGLTPGTRELFHEAWRRYVAAVPGDLNDKELVRLAAALWGLFQIPSRMWGFQHEMSGRHLNDYVTAMLHALMLAMPDEGKGDEWKDRDTLFPCNDVRRAYAEQLRHLYMGHFGVCS